MPGNSLALQMPPAHQPENFDPSIPIPNYYIYNRLSDSGSHLWEFPLRRLNGPHLALRPPEGSRGTQCTRAGAAYLRNLAVGVLPLLLPHAQPNLAPPEQGQGRRYGGLRGRRRGLQWSMEDNRSKLARIRGGEHGGPIRSANKLTTHSKALFLFFFPPSTSLSLLCMCPT